MNLSVTPRMEFDARVSPVKLDKRHLLGLDARSLI